MGNAVPCLFYLLVSFLFFIFILHAWIPSFLIGAYAPCYCQDDGELYDEFGNLKKKFRAKTQQAEAGRTLPGAGRAGWEVEELGNFCFIFGFYGPLSLFTSFFYTHSMNITDHLE